MLSIPHEYVSAIYNLSLAIETLRSQQGKIPKADLFLHTQIVELETIQSRLSQVDKIINHAKE